MSFGIPVRNGVGIGLGSYALMSLAGFPSSTLSQTFAGAAALDASITFSRATVASYTNAAGVLTQAASNEPRFDYDPVTLAPLGLIIEEARTNLLLNSTINGTQVPADIASRLNDEGQVLRDTDWHIEDLNRDLIPGLTVVQATFHRYVIDANRDPSGQSLYLSRRVDHRACADHHLRRDADLATGAGTDRR